MPTIEQTDIFRVARGYEGERLCRTSAEAARFARASMTRKEQSCISEEALKKVLDGLQKGVEIKLFDRRIRTTTLYG